MILGEIRLNLVLWVYIPSIFLVPVYTYYMAVKHKEEPPFPHATITSTACHYPQDIVMRFIMLMGSSFLFFVFFVAYRWIQFQADRTGFKKYSKTLFYLAEASIFCYSVTIGTIDGKGTGSAHDINAVIFFVIWFAVIISMTVYITKMYNWDTTIMSAASLRLKQIIAGYIVAIWLYCLGGLIFQNTVQNGQDIYVVIVQWNSVWANLLWVLSFVFEWKHFKLALYKPTRREPLPDIY